MEAYSLNNMIRGWFIVNFEPSVLKTSEYEVGVKKYRRGDKEDRHYHLEADEITVIVSGAVKMDGIHYKENDIIVIRKGKSTDFECLSDEAVTVVVKTKSVAGDKYIDTI